jgi:drug/metabolite transporter (DMT)-like permease
MISFSPVWVKLAGVDPSVSAFYRVFLGGLVLWLLVGIRRCRAVASPATVMITGVLGLVLAVDLTVWHRSIGYVGPGLATILGNFQVFLLAAFGMAFLGERLTARFLSAVLAAMVGLFLMFGLGWGQLSSDYRLGVFFGLLTAFFYGVFLLGLRGIQSGPNPPQPIVTVAWLSLTASVVLGVAIGTSGGSFAVPDVGTGLALVAYGVVTHVVAWVLISHGLPQIETSRAGLILLLQPSLAFVWDVVLFDRPTQATEVLGAVLALVAIYLGAVGGKRTVKGGEGR